MEVVRGSSIHARIARYFLKKHALRQIISHSSCDPSSSRPPEPPELRRDLGNVHYNESPKLIYFCKLSPFGSYLLGAKKQYDVAQNEKGQLYRDPGKNFLIGAHTCNSIRFLFHLNVI